MNQKLVIFCLVTCLFSWACWLPIIDTLETSPFESPATVLMFFFLGAYGPTFSAFVLTLYYDGRNGLKALLTRVVHTKVGWRWILISFFTGPILYTFALAIYTATGEETGATNYGLLPWIPIVFIVPIAFGPLAEEFGWRGFALPLLDHRNKPVQSSIILGLVWALWHTPLFWAKTGTAISGFPIDVWLIGLFFLAVVGSSFLYTWLFNRTGGSLFIAVMLHLSMNSSGTIAGMLFPDMNTDQKFLLYQFYVIAVWAIVIAMFLLRRKQTRGNDDDVYEEKFASVDKVD